MAKSKQYKTVLLTRFLGYFIFLTGILSFVVIFSPILNVEFSYRWDNILGVKRSVSIVSLPTPSDSPNLSEPFASVEPETPSGGGFGEISAEINMIVPISTDFGIVIEKINANAKVVANVNPTIEKEYVSALGEGVAHAAGTNFPGEKGNVYLFSHSTDAPWNVIRYNAVFYLLRELEPGDRVVMFYQGRRFDYIVFDKTVVKPTDITFLTTQYDQPILTLQTCDPPGTLWNRLIVRAKLAGS